MKSVTKSVMACCALALLQSQTHAQSDPDPALNNPDKLAWNLFIQVNSRAGGANAVFETFASDTDTFKPNPQYPTGPTVASLRSPILPAIERAAALEEGAVLPALPPDTTGALEETRHNRPVFDFIVQNNLYKISGLKAAVGMTLSFPIDLLEVKANWIRIDQVPVWTNNQVSVAQAGQFFHINSDNSGAKFALVSMHVISKQVPNWTWATFENRFNPGRCDIVGCHDAFGAKDANVAPLKRQGQQYPDCVKTSDLSAMLGKADIEPAYVNYCLKGSQADFVDAAGLAIRLGNSVTEQGFVPSSSCMTCHSRAAFDNSGQARPSAGFLGSKGPLGPLDASWYWTFNAQPPIYQGMPGLQRRFTPTDFVWSIPFCAIDDFDRPAPAVELQREVSRARSGDAKSPVAIADSARDEPPGAVLIGDLDPDSTLALTLHFRRRSPAPRPGTAEDLARFKRGMSKAALEHQRRRTHARAAARIANFLSAEGVTVRSIDFASRRMEIEGPARVLTALFRAQVKIYSDGDRRFRARTGALHAPRHIAPWTRAIVGFDQRPLPARTAVASGDAAGAALWPRDVAALYGVPLDRDVSNVCVGVVALGGGYSPDDLKAAFAPFERDPPKIIEVSVAGAVNNFGEDDRLDQELALDLQVVATLLPGARIVVYFGSADQQGLADALDKAVHDTVNAPHVISLSWGVAEAHWTAPRREVVNAALCDAARLRVVVVAASGDSLATCAELDGKAHVWFPASSPYVLGCGGTTIRLEAGAIAQELVWKSGSTGTGGGVSDFFPVAAFQANAQVPPSISTGRAGRGVPDVAAMAAEEPGYRIVVGGEPLALGGTSAGTPLWAALIAIADASRTAPLGLVAPILYEKTDAMRPITLGDNKADGVGYSANPGWNACAGLGVPIGAQLIESLAAAPSG